jgi:rRNA-processing protein FCF1
MGLKVIVDTNFMLLPGTQGVDIFEGIQDAANDVIELIIFDRVIDELEELTTKQGLSLADRTASRMALALIKQKNLKIEHCSNEHTDDAILKKALEYKNQGLNVAIATQDKELISRVLASKMQVFALRQKKKILLLN